MNTNINENTAEALVSLMSQGFDIVAKSQEQIKENQKKQELKLQQLTKASYNAHTKEGKSRFVANLKKQGQSEEEIASTLGLKERTIKNRIRDAKKNGR